MEKWECFQRSRAVPTLWEEREREQVLPTQPPGWCPALGLRLRSSTPRGRSSVQTVSVSESYPKVFNYLASFIEGGNPSVTTLGHTKDNHSPEWRSSYQLCRGIQNYKRCFNFELPSCCLCDDIDHILSVWRDVAGPVTLHGLIDQSSNSVAKLWVLKGVPSKKTPCLPRCQLCRNGFTCRTTPSIGGPRKCLMVEVVIDGNILIKVCDHLFCWEFEKIQSSISFLTWAWQHSGKGWGELSFSAELTVSKRSGGPQRSRWLPSSQHKLR